MSVTKRSKFITALFCVAFASPSYAYLDPGTGSIILQSLLASIAVAFGLLRFYWHQFKAFLANLVGSSAEQKGQPVEEFDKDSDTRNES